MRPFHLPLLTGSQFDFDLFALTPTVQDHTRHQYRRHEPDCRANQSLYLQRYEIDDDKKISSRSRNNGGDTCYRLNYNSRNVYLPQPVPYVAITSLLFCSRRDTAEGNRQSCLG